MAAWGFLATLVVWKLHRHHQPHAHHWQHAALQTVFLQVNAPSADFAEALRMRLEQSTISEFRALAQSQLDEPPASEDLLGWLTVMQHYGGPTRLLDWTSSPFVALYFAYSNMSEDQTGPGSLWTLWAKAAHVAAQVAVRMDLPPRDDIGRGLPGGQTEDWLTLQNNYIRLVISAGGVLHPIPVLPDNPDARMVAQQTVLTVDTTLDGGDPWRRRVHERLR